MTNQVEISVYEKPYNNGFRGLLLEVPPLSSLPEDPLPVFLTPTSRPARFRAVLDGIGHAFLFPDLSVTPLPGSGFSKLGGVPVSLPDAGFLHRAFLNHERVPAWMVPFDIQEFLCSNVAPICSLYAYQGKPFYLLFPYMWEWWAVFCRPEQIELVHLQDGERPIASVLQQSRKVDFGPELFRNNVLDPFVGLYPFSKDHPIVRKLLEASSVPLAADVSNLSV
jgi:hypothetical protein